MVRTQGQGLTNEFSVATPLIGRFGACLEPGPLPRGSKVAVKIARAETRIGLVQPTENEIKGRSAVGRHVKGCFRPKRGGHPVP